jgi:hypothetical protein
MAPSLSKELQKALRGVPAIFFRFFWLKSNELKTSWYLFWREGFSSILNIFSLNFASNFPGTGILRLGLLRPVRPFSLCGYH